MNNLKRLIIFLSTEDNYIDRVEKIIADSKENVSYIYIEDFLNNPNKFNKINKNDIIYFLCNNKLIKKVIKQIQKENCFIINKKYLLMDIGKDKCQEHLKDFNILTPRIIKYNELSKKDFPIFCKSKKHANMVMKLYNINTMNQLLYKFNVDKFYFEKDVKENDYICERKIYYVDDKIYELDNELSLERKDLLMLCRSISKCLNLELFSVDLIECKNKIYTIDVNIAPGFWNSRGSRLSLLNLLNSR